mmetsp:Transcript_19089/g.36166  ORF Transcript_19089/g.36166 Transcript_19089/m.36166 type:complete len:308 (-) Transcript_19089:121-1044(-)
MSSSPSSPPLLLVSKVVTEDETETTMNNTAIVVEPKTKSRFFAWKQLIGRILQRYTRIVGKSLHRDRLLKTLQYTVWWYSHMGLKNSQAAANLYNDVCWARYVSRLTEWPTALEALWNDSWTIDFGCSSNSNSNNNNNNNNNTLFLQKLGRILGRILAASMFVYYPAEHAAYGRWKVLPQPTTGQQRLAERYSAWSCRAWLVYILTDIVQGYVALTTPMPSNHDDDDNNNKDNNTDKDKEALLALQQQSKRHKQQVVMLRNILFLLPAYHWSLSDWDRRPWLKSTTVNLFMWLEAIVSLYQTSLEVE